MRGSSTFQRHTIPRLAGTLFVLCLLGESVHGQLVDSAQPMLGGNPQHTNFTDRAGPRCEPGVLWEVAPGGVARGVFFAQPTLDEEGNIYATYGESGPSGMRPKFIVSYEPDGTERWRFQDTNLSSRSLLNSPAVTVDGNVVVGFRDQLVRSFNQSTGVPNWSSEPLGGGIISCAAVDQAGDIYIGGRGSGGFFKISPVSGATIWESFAGLGGAASSPALSLDETTVYIGRGGSTQGLYALPAVQSQNCTLSSHRIL